MVRVCAYPGCGRKMKSWNPDSFHRLPLSKPAILREWLIALEVDETDLKTLRDRDYRVCRQHFEDEDYKKSEGDATPKRTRLKRNAVPKRRMALEASGSEVSAAEPLQQSTPTKEQVRNVPPLFKLSTPEGAAVRPRTRTSTSGQYFARPVTWRLSESIEASAPLWTPQPETSEVQFEEEEMPGDTSVQDMSISFEEMDLDPGDESFQPWSDTTTPSSQESGSGSGTGADPTSSRGHEWAGRKWMVDEDSLMDLFKFCHQCGVAMDEKKVRTRGSQITIRWSCLNGHTGQWSSCQNQRDLPRTNLLVSAAILYTGTTFTTIKEWADLINLQLPKKSQFYAYQHKYLIPAVNNAYKAQQQKIIDGIQEQSATGSTLELNGDARCDSPGFSCKYSTYSFQDDATKKIAHFEQVQVTEASSSVAMEGVGFQRGLDYILQLGINVGVMATDRSPSIRKIMRERYGNIRHEYDPWHVNKSVRKKLVAASIKRANKALQPWLKSICNHLYWACSSSNGDQEECVRRWTSLLHHICGVHRWEDNGKPYTCLHPPLTEEAQKRRRWLEHDSSAFHTLKELVLDKTLLNDLRQMALFKHTGSLEVFHSVLLKYAPKRLHFQYDTMRARTELAVMDHNVNVGRKQMTREDGDPVHRYSYSKASGQWVAKPLYEETSQEFRKNLVSDVLVQRETQSVGPWPRPPARRRRLLQNVAPVPRPDVEELLERRTSRFR